MTKHVEIILNRIEAIVKTKTMSDTDYNFLRRYSRHYNNEVRYEIAKALGIVNMEGGRTSDLLVKMLKDPAELVCVEACDSLQYKGDTSCLKALRRVLKRKSWLARGYAAETMAVICVRFSCDIEATKKLIKKCLERERICWTRQLYYCSLYILGEKSCFNTILEGLKSDDYQVSSVTMSFLKEYVTNKEDIYIIKKFTFDDSNRRIIEYDELRKSGFVEWLLNS